MSHDEGEDLIPLSAPTLAPELPPEVKQPLTTEVSLLLDQDKTKSFQSNTSPGRLSEQDFHREYDMTKLKQTLPATSDKESYNTWKARNAEQLIALTGTARKSDMAGKRSSSSKKSSESRFNTQRAHSTEHFASSSPNVESPHYSSSHRTGHYRSSELPNYVQSHNSDPRSSPGVVAQKPYHHNGYVSDTRDNLRFSNSQNVYQPQVCNPQSPHPPVMQTVSHGLQNIHQPPVSVQAVSTNSNCNCNQVNCHVNNSNCVGQPSSQDHQHVQSIPKGIAPLDVAQINNQAIVELYQIVHLQNQQIALLQQQVKQLQHGFEMDKNNEKKLQSESVSCNHFRSSENGCCVNKEINNCCSSNNHSPKKQIGVSPKRSVGIMANIVECDEEESSEESEVVEEKVSKKSKKQNSNQKKLQAKSSIKNTLSTKSKRSSEGSETRRRKSEEAKVPKQKKNYVSPHERKSSKGESKKISKQVDNSFTLNEADLVVRTETDEDDDSPYPSIHIDLQDYSSSDSASDSRTSSAESCSDEESSDTKLGWTFYNRVVNQVNNLLKKNPHHANIDQPTGSRRFPTTDRKEEFDTENNWSKRVTFHGPPPESSDDFMMNMMQNGHQFQPPRPNQDYRDFQGGPPERMQDFMMYNLANGNTNMSFGTFRYLERYDLLPPHFKSKRQEQTYQQDYQRPRHSQMKQKGSRTSDNFHQVPQPTHKRRSREDRRSSSSKLLDITSLRQ